MFGMEVIYLCVLGIRKVYLKGVKMNLVPGKKKSMRIKCVKEQSFEFLYSRIVCAACIIFKNCTLLHAPGGSAIRRQVTAAFS